MKLKYTSYDQKTPLDEKNQLYHRNIHNRSIMDLDPGDEAFSQMSEDDIKLATCEDYTSEEDEAINNYNAHFINSRSVNMNRRHKDIVNPFFYNCKIDMSNYQKKQSKFGNFQLIKGFLSPKYARFAVQEETETKYCIFIFYFSG